MPHRALAAAAGPSRPAPRLAILAAAAAITLVLAACASGPVAGPPPTPRIQIREAAGVAEFYDTATGVAFQPRGYDLVEFRAVHDPVFGDQTYDMVLSPGYYDPAHARADLHAMRALGYNVVRVMIDTCGNVACIYPYGSSARGLDPAYLDDIADLLAAAAEEDVVVWLTSNTLPDGGYYYPRAYAGASGTIAPSQAVFLTSDGIEAYREYLQDLLNGLVARHARLDRLFSLSLRNEYWYDTRDLPWTMTSGTVTPADGMTYDMADPADRRRLAEDSLVYWTNKLTAVVKRVVPDALVSVGFFAPAEPNPFRLGDFRLVYTAREFREANADFYDLHAYPDPSGPTLDALLENFGATGFEAKPLVMGELGAFIHAYPDVYVAAQTLADWQTVSCLRGIDGWLAWHWHGDTVEGLWGGEGTPLGTALAPSLHPDPCVKVTVPDPNMAHARPATASAALVGQPASYAVDGTGLQWGSGGDAPQWVEIDLGSPQPLGSLRLSVAQYPAGTTVHEVYGGLTSPASSLLVTFSGATQEGDVLTHTFATPPTVRYLRVVTTSSPSWVAWREIEAYPP